MVTRLAQFDLSVEARGARIIGRIGRFIGGSLEEPAGIIPQRSDHLVVRNAVEPGTGIFGNALREPRAERRHQCRLHRVLDQLDMPNADAARQCSDEPPVLATKEMLN
jgi:hypothetical protein